MLEDRFIEYGVFGLWTLSNLYLIRYFLKKENEREGKLIQIIEQNTKVITKVLDATQHCKKNRK